MHPKGPWSSVVCAFVNGYSEPRGCWGRYSVCICEWVFHIQGHQSQHALCMHVLRFLPSVMDCCHTSSCQPVMQAESALFGWDVKLMKHSWNLHWGERGMGPPGFWVLANEVICTIYLYYSSTSRPELRSGPVVLGTVQNM